MRREKIKNFKLNAEMLGKVSCFLSKGNFVGAESTSAIRIEQSCLGGARITATDRCRLIIFIDSGSDFSGPALSLEDQGYPLSKFTKECRKTKSSIKKLRGYARFKPGSGKVALNGNTFKFSFNTDKWLKTDGVLEDIIYTAELKLPLFNSRYINSIRHCILSEEKANGKGMPHVAFSHFKAKKSGALGSIAFSRHAILVMMSVHSIPHENNLLSRMNSVRDRETNPFVLAVMEKEWRGIFTKLNTRN